MSEANSKSTTIVGAIIALIGVISGSLITGFMSKNLWENQIVYEQKKQVLDQRIKLIEKVSKLANLAPQMRNLQNYVQLQSSLLNTPEVKRFGIKVDEPSKVLEIANKRAELNAEFASTLQLVALYFGPKSKASAQKLSTQQPWWEIGEPSFRELINAMNEELNNNIPNKT